MRLWDRVSPEFRWDGRGEGVMVCEGAGSVIEGIEIKKSWWPGEVGR